MSDATAGFGDARKLEDMRFNQWIVDSAGEVRQKVQASERSLAARGLAMSGMRFSAEVDIIFSSIEEVVGKAIAFRQELGAKVPALLEPGNLKILQDKLDQYVDGGVRGVRARAQNPPNRGAIGDAMGPHAEQKAYAIKARLKARLAALPLEARLGLHKKEEPKVTTLNISNSTISNLNLGTVVGDLNSSIHQLTTAGRAQLAEEVRKMTDAIGSSQEVADDARKDLLEHLSVVSEESAKPPEQRKMGPLKSSLAVLKAGVPTAAQLFGIYQGLEHALKAAGVIQ